MVEISFIEFIISCRHYIKLGIRGIVGNSTSIRLTQVIGLTS